MRDVELYRHLLGLTDQLAGIEAIAITS